MDSYINDTELCYAWLYILVSYPSLVLENKNILRSVLHHQPIEHDLQ